MKPYKALLERTMFIEVEIEAHSDDEALVRAWEAAIAYEKEHPITDELGEIGVSIVEEVK